MKLLTDLYSCALKVSCVEVLFSLFYSYFLPFCSEKPYYHHDMFCRSYNRFWFCFSTPSFIFYCYQSWLDFCYSFCFAVQDSPRNTARSWLAKKKKKITNYHLSSNTSSSCAAVECSCKRKSSCTLYQVPCELNFEASSYLFTERALSLKIMIKETSKTERSMKIIIPQRKSSSYPTCFWDNGTNWK